MSVAYILAVIAGGHSDMLDLLQGNFCTFSEGFTVGDVLARGLRASDACEQAFIQESKVQCGRRAVTGIHCIFWRGVLARPIRWPSVGGLNYTQTHRVCKNGSMVFRHCRSP